MKPIIVSNIANPTHVARVLSPVGSYPSKTVIFRDALYIAHDDVCFTVCTCDDPWEEDVYSELQLLSVSEVRLYGALTVAVDRESDFVSFYPHERALYFRGELGSDPVAWAKKHVLPLLIDRFARSSDPDGIRFPDSGTPLPPLLGGPKYDLRLMSDGYYQLAERVFAAIDREDELSIRGLSTLIKAAMLQRHYQFFEEALNTLFISLECTFRMVLGTLEANGLANPSASDAATFIHDALFDVRRVERYFEEDYEKRVISFHPESRYGAYPYPPLSADDYYNLFDELLEVYVYLFTGYVHPWRLKRAGILGGDAETP